MHKPANNDRGRGFGRLKEFGILGPRLAEEAFRLTFPATNSVRNKAAKLEAEIYITAKDAASDKLINEVSGQTVGSEKTPRYKIGNHWHFITDPEVLAKATTDQRERRKNHAFRNESLVTVELDGSRRYYFLLSPVQLGPAGLKYAMAHPSGLTPLLKPEQDGNQPDPPKDLDPTSSPKFIGPSPEDVLTNGVFVLPVIDPYAWAEGLVNNFLSDILKLQEWLKEDGGKDGKSQTLKDLEAKTGWTTKHYFIARVLKTVADSPVYSGDIPDQLLDPKKWNEDLAAWQNDLVRRNAEINAAVHRDIAEIIVWMWGDGHEIIEQALYLDASGDSLQDALDIARGIIHWAICSEYAMAVQPGVRWLQRIFETKNTFLYQDVLKHLDGLDLDEQPTPSTANEYALRIAFGGVLQILISA